MHEEVDEAALTAYALGELTSEEREAVEALLATSEDARQEVEEIHEAAQALRQALASAPRLALTPGQRAGVEAAARKEAISLAPPRRAWSIVGTVAAVLAVVGVTAAISIPSLLRARVPVQRNPALWQTSELPPATLPPAQPFPATRETKDEGERLRALGYHGYALDKNEAPPAKVAAGPSSDLDQLRASSAPFHTDAYDHIRDNPFILVAQDPRSTFSVDVDTASYSIVRRYLMGGTLPPKDAVRIEELINYFRYDYAQPTDDHPFAVHMETAASPWTRGHRLVRIGIKGREVPRGERPPSNLVFLLDVSGSMDAPDRLPLVRAAMRLLVEELGPQDRVAIAVYAGSEGLVLPSTPAKDKAAILSAIESLTPGGSTHGSAGIRLAYETAAASFIKGGVNRVILATDGDFNVGVTSQGELVRLIEEKAKSGVFLTALGFGMGNLKDSTLEKLADHGNGHYAYIDSLSEARKVLVEEAGSTLVAIAKDVKLQVEFNPARVKAFRLIGYENRVLAHQDFNDDRKDAGDIGAGHTVTALYEIVPPGVEIQVPGVDPLKYQEPRRAEAAAGSDDLLTLKLRYKQPDGDRSALIEVPLEDRRQAFSAASVDFRFAAAVAAFGMSLRESPYKGDADLTKALGWARESLGADEGGLRAELLTLIERARGAPRR
jgi:Ca-activated chloride channel homolog